MNECIKKLIIALEIDSFCLHKDNGFQILSVSHCFVGIDTKSRTRDLLITN